MKIGELADRSGSSVRSLRHYESKNLLTPSRARNGYREFHECAVAEVAVIRTLISAGLTTKTIATLLPCVEMIGGKATPCSDLVSELHKEKLRLEHHITSLRESAQILESVIASAAVDA